MLERMYLSINYLRFLPHILLFCITKNKEIIREDIIAYRNEYQLKGNDIHVFIQFLMPTIPFQHSPSVRNGILLLSLPSTVGYGHCIGCRCYPHECDGCFCRV